MEEVRLVPMAAGRALTNHLILGNILHWISLDDNEKWRADTPLDPDLQINVDAEAALKAQGVRLFGYWYGWGGVLLRCMLVSRLWYFEGIKVLWRDPVGVFGYCGWNNSLVALLGSIEPARRQFYADLVESGLVEIGAWSGGDSDLLHTLEFPKMKHLKLNVDAEDFTELKVGKNAVEIIEIDPLHESAYPAVLGLCQNGMESLLDHIAVSGTRHARF